MTCWRNSLSEMSVNVRYELMQYFRPASSAGATSSMKLGISGYIAVVTGADWTSFINGANIRVDRGFVASN
jgi:hypothetical protein